MHMRVLSLPQVIIRKQYNGFKVYGEDGTTESIQLPKENVLKFILEDSSWVTVRPSGTEPKCKFYVGVKQASLQSAEQLINELKMAF